MKNKSFVVFFLSIMILEIGCVKEKNNQNPTVVFLQPANNIVIDQDTVMTIHVEANDADGEVNKVELFIDGALAEVFNSPPYQYAWTISQTENNGLHTIQAIAHDNNGATGQAEISIDIHDFRTKYLGDFYFRVITESWMLGQTTTYDTSYYNGLIRTYELTDSENDLFSEDDSAENPDEKITLEFKENTKITSLLAEDGGLITKTGYHYSHQGGFTDLDTISFTVGGLGGLGAGYNYEILGIRE